MDWFFVGSCQHLRNENISQETAEDLEKQLDSIQELPESESYPLFHLLPEVVQHYTKLLTLPNELRDFVTSRRPPADCLRICKEVAIATYEGARKVLGDAEAVVCVPTTELLQVYTRIRRK